jgi:hypothetical protein
LYAIAPAKIVRTRGFALIIHAAQALKKMAVRGMLLALECWNAHARPMRDAVGPITGRQDAKRYCDDCIAAYGLGF